MQSRQHPFKSGSPCTVSLYFRVFLLPPSPGPSSSIQPTQPHRLHPSSPRFARRLCAGIRQTQLREPESHSSQHGFCTGWGLRLRRVGLRSALFRRGLPLRLRLLRQGLRLRLLLRLRTGLLDGLRPIKSSVSPRVELEWVSSSDIVIQCTFKDMRCG